MEAEARGHPDFDTRLQHEGVTCNVCHLREGKILGVYGDSMAPHPVEKISDGNEVCVRCHVAPGNRWDTFFKFPPRTKKENRKRGLAPFLCGSSGTFRWNFLRIG